MTEKVINLGKAKKFPTCGELSDRLYGVVLEYDGEIGLAEAIGVLELVKARLIANQVVTE